MDREKLQKAMSYASQNPQSEFAVELRSRINRGAYNSVLKAEGVDVSKFGSPKKEGFLKRAGKALIKSETEFGTSLAGAADIFSGGRLGGGRGFEQAQTQEAQTTTQLLKVIREKRQRGEDTSRFEKLLPSFTQPSQTNELLERQASLSNRQVVGQGLGVATDIIGAGTIGKAGAATVLQPTSIIKGALKGAGVGAATGGGFGAAQGLARGLQDDRQGADLASEVISGGLIGGVAGGVLGGVTGGISGGLRGRALRKEQILKQLTDDPDTIARFQLDDTGKLVKNKEAQAVIKQGIPEKQVAVVTGAGKKDKTAFQEMFKIAQKGEKNALVQERAIDQVGHTLVDRTKNLQNTLRAAGESVDEAATSLTGKKVNILTPVESFTDDLQAAGVTLKKGDLDFVGSDYEGIAPVEKLLKDVFKRLERGDLDNFDATTAHKLKRFIDNKVSFGKQTEGITGSAEIMLKRLRRGVDGTLDDSFSNYATANDEYARAIQLWDFTRDIMGKNFDPSQQVSSQRAGSIMRRILGNSAKRGDIMAYMVELEKFTKATGKSVDDDLVRQVVFADMLEDVFGTNATTGFQGGITRGVEQAAGVAQDAAQGQPVSAAVKGGIKLFQASRGITDEAKVAALAKLIGL